MGNRYTGTLVRVGCAGDVDDMDASLIKASKGAE